MSGASSTFLFKAHDNMHILYLPFLLLLILLILPSGCSQSTVHCSKDKDVKIECAPSEITAKEGSNATLKCQSVPACDFSRNVTEWRNNSQIVHSTRRGMDYLDGQAQAYIGRTEAILDDMVKGILSLKLINVTKRDEGTYDVIVASTVLKGHVSVKVEDKGTNEILSGESDNEGIDCPWWCWLVVAAAVSLVFGVSLAIGCIVNRRRNNRHPQHSAGGKENRQTTAANQENIPLREVQQNDSNYEQSPLQNGNVHNFREI